jgi:hypothetical protein
MAAMGLLSIAILALISAFIGGMRMMQQSTQLTMATDVGSTFLENVKAFGYDGTEVGTYDGRIPVARDLTTGFPPDPYPQGLRNGESFALMVECTQHTPTTRFVKVTIHWSSDRQTELSTMVHR